MSEHFTIKARHLRLAQAQLDGLQALAEQPRFLLRDGRLGAVQQRVEDLGVLAAQRLQPLHDGLGVEDDLILAQSLQGFFTRIHHGGHCLVSYTLWGGGDTHTTQHYETSEHSVFIFHETVMRQ